MKVTLKYAVVAVVIAAALVVVGTNNREQPDEATGEIPEVAESPSAWEHHVLPQHKAVMRPGDQTAMHTGEDFDDSPDEGARPLITRVDGDETDSAPPENFPPSHRWRRVRLSTDVMRKDGFGVGDQMELNLFSDARYVATIDRVAENVEGTLTVRGQIQGSPYGYILISCSGDRVLANISLPEENRMFRIQNRPDDEVHYVLELDMEKQDVLPPSEPLIPPASEGRRPALVADVTDGDVETDLPESFSPVNRWRKVRMNDEVTCDTKIRVGDEIVLNLFPDSEYSAEIDHVSRNVMGAVALRGRIQGYEYGHVVISTSADGRTVVNINIPEENRMYRIVSAPDGETHYVLDVDMERRDRPRLDGPRIPVP